MSQAQPPGAEKVLTERLLARDIAGPRPDPPGKATEVNISMYLYDVSKINGANQNFDTDFQIVYRWLDPRLASKENKIRQFSLEDIWNPQINIMNFKDVKPLRKDKVFVDSNGRCVYTQRYLAKFTVPLNLKDFPKDKHRLYIQARSLYAPDQVKLVIDPELTGMSNVVSIPDWTISGGEAEISTFSANPEKQEMVQMKFSFKVDRLFGFYFWKIILPLFLIVVMSWGVFWIDPRRLESQVPLSATAVLTLVAFQFAISDLVPHVSYLTRMDKFTILCSILIFLALIVAVLTAYFTKREWHNEALVVERFARVIFPIIFAGIVYYAFFV